MSPSTRPGRVRGRPARRAIVSLAMRDRKARDRGAARRWSPGPAVGTGHRRAGAPWRSARPGTGPAPPFLSFVVAPDADRVAQHRYRQPRRVNVLGGVSRAPAACCARGSPCIGRDRPRRALRLVTPRPQHTQDFSHVPSPDQRRCRHTPSSSSYRSAGPATGTPPGSGTRSRQSPSGGHSTGAPAGDGRASAAPAAATPHRSAHAGPGDHPFKVIYTNQDRRFIETRPSPCQATGAPMPTVRRYFR